MFNCSDKKDFETVKCELSEFSKREPILRICLGMCSGLNLHNMVYRCVPMCWGSLLHSIVCSCLGMCWGLHLHSVACSWLDVFWG